MIGEKIRQIRERQKMSQSELARTVKVTQSMITQIERGTKAVSMPLGVEIAKALNCTISDFIDD